jgi:glycosyltransferase involved in cell wall biosynthesis
VQARNSLRVAIDAQILPARNGGVAHALLALVRALGVLEGGETYRLVVASEEEAAYWRPWLSRNQELVLINEWREAQRKKALNLFWRITRPFLRPLRSRMYALFQPPEAIRHWPEVPISDGFYESLGCDVLHIPWQRFVLCALPTIYNPHDVQHLYFPQFFPPEQLAWRETMYPMGCRFARTVVVGSEWAGTDILRHYKLDPEKLQVVTEGAPNQVSPSVDADTVQRVKERYGLPDRFLLYPAKTWPHKNHLRLLEALAHLRKERNLVVPLVLSGAQYAPFWPQIEERIRNLDLRGQVHCLGFLPETDLRAIHTLASCLVQPSLFEASSLPIFDAWLDGVPVACARATALPEQVRDAALLFDPYNSHDIAEAIAKIMTNSDVREELRARGFRRLKDFDWGKAAKTYRAIYRRAANWPLTEEDSRLLGRDVIRESPKKLEQVTS